VAEVADVAETAGSDKPPVRGEVTSVFPASCDVGDGEAMGCLTATADPPAMSRQIPATANAVDHRGRR